MPAPIDSYWELIEPMFDVVDTGHGPGEFVSSISNLPRPSVLLYAAHMCVSEVHNGGFLQLFWNSSGVLVPEAIEALNRIGMPILASIVSEAAHPLGTPYPRDRDERWDALITASGRTLQDAEEIFSRTENLYIAFVKVTEPLNLDALDKRFWVLVQDEGEGFQEAATRYAQKSKSPEIP
jgi:Domain of unknown function (DUF4375)